MAHYGPVNYNVEHYVGDWNIVLNQLLDTVRKHLSDLIFSAAGTNVKLKGEILKRINDIIEELDIIDDIRNQTSAQKKLS